ncbi:MAG: hypothetical protein IT423_18070, partial [Pirellulaceae bacterium]|nr:hypothetical protein [Pirellulaceae bacterium]
EEHKHPRIFAFFPIALLSVQFLTLVSTKTLSVIPVEWLGMGCVMMSATILLTARTVAEVFRKRTGNLVRPLPWNLVVPLLIGLLVLVAGVVVSGFGFSLIGSTTKALPPTALVAGGLLVLVALDTGVSGFAWGALLLLTVAYQTCPTLVSGLIQTLKHSAAQAVNEARLPVAFYGITYLPLIVVLMLAGNAVQRCSLPAHSRGWGRLAVFVMPLRKFATLLTVCLFVLALLNLKAISIVSLLDIPLLLCMAVLFQDRRFGYGALGCSVIASVLFVPLVRAMGWWDLSPAHILTSAVGMSMFLIATPWLDRAVVRIPRPSPSNRDPLGLLRAPTKHMAVCLLAGIGLALAAAVVWMGAAILALPSISMLSGLQLVLVLAAILWATVRTQDYYVACTFWLTLGAGGLVLLARQDYPVDRLLNGALIGVALVSLGSAMVMLTIKRRLGAIDWSRVRNLSTSNFCVTANTSNTSKNTLVSVPLGLARDASETDDWLVAVIPAIPISSAAIAPSQTESMSGQGLTMAILAVALSDLSFALAGCLAALYCFPQLLVTNALAAPILIPIGLSCMMAWSVALAWLFRSRWLGGISATWLPLWASAMVQAYSIELGLNSVNPFSLQAGAWMLTAASLTLVTFTRSAQPWRTMSQVAQVWVAIATMISLLNADPLFRIIGLSGLAIACLIHQWMLLRIPATLVAILANLHLFILVLYFGGVEGWFYQWPFSLQLPTALTYLFPVLALSIGVFDLRRLRLEPNVCQAWSFCIRSLWMLMGLGAFVASHQLSGALPWFVAGFVVYAVIEFTQAVRHQTERFVWTGLAGLVALGLWLVKVDVIELGMGVSQIALAVASGIGLLLAHLLADGGKSSESGTEFNNLAMRPRHGWQVFAGPMLWIGMVCPGVLTAMAVMRMLTDAAAIEPINTLTMLAAAVVYFHQGLIRKQRGYIVLATVIMNAALMFTWRGFGFHDVQLYCVPVGLSLIGLVQLLKRELPTSAHNPLRYAGALVVLVSPLFQIMDGSWLHLITLLALSVLVILLAIGLRLRALIHTGTAFLLADLVMMVVRSTHDYPSLLWISGLALGVAVIVLAAVCERHREQLLSRIRLLSAELATWN